MGEVESVMHRQLGVSGVKFAKLFQGGNNLFVRRFFGQSIRYEIGMTLGRDAWKESVIIESCLSTCGQGRKVAFCCSVQAMSEREVLDDVCVNVEEEDESIVIGGLPGSEGVAY